MDLEAKVIALWRESLQCLMVALAGSDIKSFWDLMTSYFGSTAKDLEEDDPWGFIDAAPTIPRPLPLTDTDSDEDRQSTQSAPVGSRSTAAREVKSHPLLPTKNDLLEDLCSLKKAIWMYPLDEYHLKETGIPEELLARQEQCTTVAGASVYVCVHPKCQRPPFYSQSPAGLYSHVRRKHLSIALAWPYCVDKTY